MFAAQHIPYSHTASFSSLVIDYLNGTPAIQPFYSFGPNREGIWQSIEARKNTPVNREVLVDVLKEQYAGQAALPLVEQNIQSLLSQHTFTVCTAHQPNLFTGPLYFMYKVLHTIKLSFYLKEQFPQYHFVPIYYMGSEDADFAELNHTYVDGKKIEWKKEQGGAVGRMLVDKTLIQLIDELESQLTYEPFGSEVISLLRTSYTIGRSIQNATFELVNRMYGTWGLLVLIPDHPRLKAQMNAVFTDDIFAHTPSMIVSKTSERLGKEYNVQAYPREINLFYLRENIRERIEQSQDAFQVLNTDIQFSANALREELDSHPERFSPNVILRGLFQETILPNLAFVGGGGETAYWLQLKDLFTHYGVPYPVLVLRNSFLIVETKWKAKLEKLALPPMALFQSENELMKGLVAKNAGDRWSLNGEIDKAAAFYETVREQAATIDPTLYRHVEAIKSRSLNELQELEKKMLRAEKRKYAAQQRQIVAIKEVLFPRKGLQERVENFSSFYAKWGTSFIEELLKHSPALEQEFTILTEIES